MDAKGINSLSSLVTEGGHTFIRHYLLDFSSALGSASIMPREGWEGYEPLVENKGDIGKRIIGLGFNIPEWRRLDFFESPSIGRLPKDHSNWNPSKWSAHITNAAFRHLRPDDTFWAAHKLTAISDDMIKAAVAEGQFGDPTSEEFLVTAISQRRARVLQTYLPAVNPVVNPAIVSGRLTFGNAAVDAGVSPVPVGYRAIWSNFDNNTRPGDSDRDDRGCHEPTRDSEPAGGGLHQGRHQRRGRTRAMVEGRVRVFPEERRRLDAGRPGAAPGKLDRRRTGRQPVT